MTVSKDTSMLGRGVKRKWSCLEELEADTVPAAVTEEKQQNVEDDGEDMVPSRSDLSHLQQRQLVLGLCLEKLQRYQAGMELSLRRSVLLINTLRQIQEDMQSDGVDNTDVLLSSDSYLLRDGIREDRAVTCPGCAEDNGENLPSEVSGMSEQQKSLPAATITAFSDAASAMGYLSDLALDDIFEDIDTSMYETSELPAAWASGSLWPLWTDEDLKVRPVGHTSAGSLQSCLMDLNELDHIMEILVKS